MIRVLLCHPCYGGLQVASVTAAARATKRKDTVEVHLYHPDHALLAKGFNEPVAHALRESYDYFALLHGDIAPDDWWFDTLLDLLRHHELDAIHAVSPIKDGRGLTSTAIAYNSDIFAPVRRITVKELLKLPSTFDLASIRSYLDPDAERLLPNTGCLVMPATTWLRDFPGFCVLDRIVREGGEWAVDTCPEDWNFGHWCAANGVRVGGTTEVAIRHYGRHEYKSSDQWAGIPTRISKKQCDSCKEYAMRFEAKDGEATLWVYDPIGEMFGPDAVTAKGVRDRLSSLRSIDKLMVRINSPGGEVDDATTIHTLISEFQGEKVVKIDGVAASTASVIAMAGDRIEMAKGSRLMIHNPWTIALGDYRELLKASEVAKHYRDGLVDIYSARSGKKPDDIRAKMDAETWFLADEAVDFGIADSVGDSALVQASATGEQIMAQAVLVAKLAFAKLVSGTASEVQAAMENMAHAADRIAAAKRERELALAGARLANCNK